jgi:molecular chaperone HscB
MTTDAQSIPTKCLNCQSALTTPIVCDGCHSLYPPPPWVDYFALLGLPRTYAIDPKKLNTSFRAIARGVHPDRFAGAASEVQSLATRLSAEVNQAFHVLSDPVRRAGYLLELAGGPSPAEMREVPSELLTEVMMLREQIDEAKTIGNDAALERQREIIAARRQDTLRQIAALAESIAGLDEPRRRVLRRLLNSIKYFDNLLIELAADPLALAARATNE